MFCVFMGVFVRFVCCVVGFVRCAGADVLCCGQRRVLNSNERKIQFEILSNPEFLAEGVNSHSWICVFIRVRIFICLRVCACV